MTDSARPPNPATSLFPGPAVESPAAEFLRAEQAGVPQGAARALLLHELGVLEEHGGDEMGAAREYLAAFNAFPQFREPLEGLVRLLERRRSVKNLPKLLEALLRAAESPEERTRALLKRAAFSNDTKGDPATARVSLEQATEERPDDPTAWLELEVLAGKTGDAELRERALEARAKLVEDPSWHGLLLLSLADLIDKRGDPDAALAVLESARDLSGLARYPAIWAIERIGSREKREGVVPQALESLADLVSLSMTDPAAGEGFGVPATVRNNEVITDLLLRAADARRREGDGAAAARLLDSAILRAGEKPVIVSARLLAAEALGDTATADRMAHVLLEKDIGNRARASLWLRVAEAAGNRSDVAGALEALGKALEADPGSIPARSLQIDLLAGAGDPAALAASVEAMAAALPTADAKGRGYLLAAYIRAIDAHDNAGAKAALARAGEAKTPAAVLARVTRFLATLTGDTALLDESLAQLIASGPPDRERLGLWFEVGRARLLRRDEQGAAEAWTSMTELPDGGLLGRALGAYTIGVRSGEGAALPPDKLDQLRKSETDATVARALAIAAVRRADRAQDIDGARQRLRELVAADAEDTVSAVYLAELERRLGRPLEAARALSSAAGGTVNADLSALLHLEAGILLFQNGERRAAVEELDAAMDVTPAAARPLLGWALRCADGPEPERAVARLERATELGEDAALLAIERIGVQLFGPRRDPTVMEGLLATAEQSAVGDLGLAAALARLVADPEASDRDAHGRAVNRIAQAGEKAAGLCAFERLRVARADGANDLAAGLARTFADAQPSLASALEWLGAAWAARDRDAEAEARRRAAGFLSGSAKAALEASAALVELVNDPGVARAPVDSDQPAARLTNLELSPPGGDPERRAAALTAFGGAMPDDSSRLDATLLAGYNLLAHGDAEAALISFTAVVDARPDDLAGWEGVRSAAVALEDATREAIAASHLGELCADDARAAEYWEASGLLFLDKLGEADQAEVCFEQAFERDATRGVAFDRLFRRVRDRKDSEKMLALIARRLDMTEEPSEIAKLYWERARVLRQKGDVEGALSALENVTLIEADHVGALALRAEMDISRGDFAAAAASLGRLAGLADAPSHQRLMSGVAATDLYENKLGDSQSALVVLADLHKSGLATLPVRERLVRAAAKTGSWQKATDVLEELMEERPTSEGRIEAARLAMAIWRDKLEQPKRAARAVSKLLDEAPDDGEALELVLTTKLEPSRDELLTNGRDALVGSLVKNPIQKERLERLARIAMATGDLPLRQATLGVIKAVVGTDSDIEGELLDLDSRVASMPQVAVDDDTVGLIGDPDDTGPLTQLFAALAEPIAQSLGPSLDALGVTKKNRIDPRSGLPLRNEIAAWAGALGLGEFALYVGGNEPQGVQGIAAEESVLVVGSEITAPLSPSARQAVARELFALRRGITVARTRDDTTVAAIVVAACHLANVHIDAPHYAMLADVQRLLGKALSRRTKKALPELCARVTNEQQDPRQWARAALASMYRMAAIAAGDASLVLLDALNAPLSRLPSLVAHDDRGRRLVAFVLSPQYLELRSRLGMGVE